MSCNLCPNRCGINRNKEKGSCGTDSKIRIAKFYLHKFEEPIISGNNGSGTIFFSGCSLKCVFCQNFELSRGIRGKEFSVKELTEIFQKLENDGAHNINLVNPTHFSDKIIEALEIYKPKIPVVYNTHGYENIDILKKIDKYVDVYLPDMKYCGESVSTRYTGKKNYFEVASKAIEFMANKPFILGDDGLLKSGTIVRHLVLPQNLADSRKIIDWFTSIKDKAYINIMSQYTPFGDIEKFPELQRKLSFREYEKIIDYAVQCGIENMFFQERESANETYIPSWDF